MALQERSLSLELQVAYIMLLKMHLCVKNDYRFKTKSDMHQKYNHSLCVKKLCPPVSAKYIYQERKTQADA